MNVFTKPASEPSEVTPRKRIVEWSDRDFRGGEDLRRINVAQSVGRKISDETLCPMHVLQATCAMILRRHAKVALIRFSPCVREISGDEISREQCTLELEANHDVHVVRDFIGLDANDARLDTIDCVTKILE